MLHCKYFLFNVDTIATLKFNMTNAKVKGMKHLDFRFTLFSWNDNILKLIMLI